MEGITIREKEIIEKRGYKFTSESPKGKKINGVIMVVHNPSRRHESGFPFIRSFGVMEGGELVDMGWHDHYCCDLPTNTDALGKNIFHVMPWGVKRGWAISEHFISTSSLSLYETGIWM